MVEGPGATRNARKLQPAIGLHVVQLEAPCFKLGRNLTYVGTQLMDVFSVGKEVFLLFGNDTLALRLHFGMNGSLCLRTRKAISSHLPKWRQQDEVCLCIHLQALLLNDVDENTAPSMPGGYILECRGTVVNEVSAFVACSKRTRLGSRDVCSNRSFDALAVLEALRTRPTAMITDAILDQDKFPGVGNIIKVEGLHLASIHPKRTVSSLSDEELQSVIVQCRKYAMSWLLSGRAPNKHVYNLTTCQSCNGALSMAKLGKDLSRVTFWCEICQPLLGVTGKERQIPDESLRPFQQARLLEDRPFSCLACPLHGTRSVQVRRVRKLESIHRNRLFASCRACAYFAWADGHFPNCTHCQKRVILRISKTERSGGQWFLSCDCQHNVFAWATPQQLGPLEPYLTPLL